MPTPAQNTQIRNATTGFQTVRPSTASGNTPLAASATTLFTVAGGRILIISLVGQVTTVIQAQATTVQFISTPTTGSAVNLSNATGDLNALQVGGTVALASTLGGTAVVANAGANVIAQPKILVPVGNITVTMGAASTGALKYELIWVAYDSGASVTAGA